MEPSSQVSQEQQLIILEAQIRECFGRVVWSHKTQEKCADIVLKIHKRIKFWMIVLSATTTTSLLFAFLGDNKIGTMVGAGLSTLLFALTSYSKDYDLGEIAQKHIKSANELWNIRETYLSLLTDIKISNISPNEITKKRDALQAEVLTIYKGSPRTHSKAYNEACKALKKNEEYTFSDVEIDAFLPNELKKHSLTIKNGSTT